MNCRGCVGSGSSACGVGSIARSATVGQGTASPWYFLSVLLTLIPETIGVGTVAVGDRRYPILRLPSTRDGVQVDVIMSFADLGQLIAECSDLRAREAAR